jgi:5-formaminoimidazole-4-carboxamide-1-beta-D-ribofuranosyl 5'-monophosphate synthetase
MTNEDIFKNEPVLIHNGEEAKLSEIISKKKILSVTINYLSKERKVKLPGIKGAFGLTKNVQDEKEIIITDLNGIQCNWDKNELVNNSL